MLQLTWHWTIQTESLADRVGLLMSDRQLRRGRRTRANTSSLQSEFETHGNAASHLCVSNESVRKWREIGLDSPLKTAYPSEGLSRKPDLESVCSSLGSATSYTLPVIRDCFLGRCMKPGRERIGSMPRYSAMYFSRWESAFSRWCRRG